MLHGLKTLAIWANFKPTVLGDALQLWQWTLVVLRRLGGGGLDPRHVSWKVTNKAACKTEPGECLQYIFYPPFCISQSRVFGQRELYTFQGNLSNIHFYQLGVQVLPNCTKIMWTKLSFHYHTTSFQGEPNDFEELGVILKKASHVLGRHWAWRGD